jgi:hypothetical protein
MKKSISLFLLFSVIVLSLLFVSSCNETPPETPPEENENLIPITNEALLDFIFTSSDVRHPRPNYYVEVLTLADFYTHTVNGGGAVYTLTADTEYDIIAAYLPNDYIEAFFGIEIHDYYDEMCNVWGFASLSRAASENATSRTEIGFKAYYVKEGDVPLKNGNSSLVFVGTELSIFKESEEYRKHIRPVIFQAKNGEKVETTIIYENFLGKKFMALESVVPSPICNDEMLYLRSILIENYEGIEVVKESLAGVKTAYLGDSFFELCLPALIHTEGDEATDTPQNVIYIYDYEQIKTLLKVK